MRPLRILAACVLAVVSSAAYAQGPPIHTDTPVLLGLDGRGVRTFLKSTRLGTLVEGDTVSAAPDAVTANALVVAAPFNLQSDRLQLGVVAPMARVESSSGVADVQLFGKYLLFKRDRRNETFRVAAKAVVKLPSGNDTLAPPLGTGSTDYTVSTVAGFLRGRLGLYAEGQLELRTSHDEVDYGNRVGYNLALAYRLTPARYGTYPARQLNGFLELNGSAVAASRRGSQLLTSTGGTTVYLSPGLSYVAGRRVLVEGSVQLPIVRRPNGRQLAPSWATLVGVRVLLY